MEVGYKLLSRDPYYGGLSSFRGKVGYKSQTIVLQGWIVTSDLIYGKNKAFQVSLNA